MTSPRLMLAAGTVAATLVGIVPFVGHGATAPAQASDGVVVAARTSSSTLVVPKGATVLKGLQFGNAAATERARLQVVRASDGATLFTGSLATFHTLPVVAGTTLRVDVVQPSRVAAARAGARLAWS